MHSIEINKLITCPWDDLSLAQGGMLCFWPKYEKNRVTIIKVIRKKCFEKLKILINITKQMSIKIIKLCQNMIIYQ